MATRVRGGEINDKVKTWKGRIMKHESCVFLSKTLWQTGVPLEGFLKRVQDGATGGSPKGSINFKKKYLWCILMCLIL